MKKILWILGLIVLSFILTMVLADLFSLYHFGDLPTFTTLTYLLFSFSFFTYLFLFLFYIVCKRMKKEKIGVKKIISFLLFFVSMLFLLGFMVVLNLDWLTYYSMGNSSPFSTFVLVRSLEFLLPGILLSIVGVLLLFKSKEEN